MKVAWTLAAPGLLLACLGTDLAAADEPRSASATPAARAADEKAVREAGAAFVRAYNAGDARSIAGLFTEDAEVIDEDGRAAQGRDAIAEIFADTFESSPGETI